MHNFNKISSNSDRPVFVVISQIAQTNIVQVIPFMLYYNGREHVKVLKKLTCTMHSVSGVSWLTGTVMDAVDVTADSLGAATSVVYHTLVVNCVSIVYMTRNVQVQVNSYTKKQLTQCRKSLKFFHCIILTKALL